MDSNTLLNDLEEINLPQFDLKETDWDPFEMDLNTLFMHAETLALLTKPLYFPNMKYPEQLSW
jgi:hypothetical protein